MSKSIGFRFYSFVSSVMVIIWFIDAALSFFMTIGSLLFGFFAEFDQAATLAVCIFGCLFALQMVQIVTPIEKLYSSKLRIFMSAVCYGAWAYISCQALTSFFIEQKTDNALWPFTLAFLAMVVLNVGIFVFYALLLFRKYNEQFREFEYMSRQPNRFA